MALARSGFHGQRVYIQLQIRIPMGGGIAYAISAVILIVVAVALSVAVSIWLLHLDKADSPSFMVTEAELNTSELNMVIRNTSSGHYILYSIGIGKCDFTSATPILLQGNDELLIRGYLSAGKLGNLTVTTGSVTSTYSSSGCEIRPFVNYEVRVNFDKGILIYTVTAH
jgi:hypothetical protein